LVLGAVCVFSGLPAIKKHEVNTDVAEFKGNSAARLGWLWIVMGILFLIAAIFDIGFLKNAIRLFFES
jgi:hypothetical protein